MYERTVLPNGLRILTAAMPHTRSVSINFFVGAGSRYEIDEVAGISHFVEHMLFKGTERRPTPREIAETIEGVGGIMNAGTDKELTVYWCKVPSAHFERALDVLADDLRFSLLRSGGDREGARGHHRRAAHGRGQPRRPGGRADRRGALAESAARPRHRRQRRHGEGIRRQQMLDYMRAPVRAGQHRPVRGGQRHARAKSCSGRAAARQLGSGDLWRPGSRRRTVRRRRAWR